MGTIIRMPVAGDQWLVVTCGQIQNPEVAVETGGLLDLTVIRRAAADGARMLVRVAGEIDLYTVPVLAEKLELARKDTGSGAGITEIVVDLRHVAFLGAAGLDVLVRASDDCARDEVRFRVVADHTAVTRPVMIMGLDLALGLCPHPDSA